MAKVEFKNIKKSYDDVEVVKHFDFTVQDGEFVVFLGPSGCGKSTTHACWRAWKASLAVRFTLAIS